METISIRKVGLEDMEQLQEIGRQTFSETFSAGNTEENMLKYLEEGFSLEKLREELENPSSSFYFASKGGSVIGYLKVNHSGAQTELRDEQSLEIERIYVLREYHGFKVGQVLFDKAMDIAQQHKVNYVWLGVWEENPRAIGFYKKNGFVEFDTYIFKLGEDEQTDIMMKKMC